MYLNRIYFGQGAYGVESASSVLFQQACQGFGLGRIGNSGRYS
jgi:membrane peptidoglycan carboxypeptidase